MTGVDLLQPTSDLVREWAHSSRLGVDVQEHLLSGSHKAASMVVHLVHDVQPFSVQPQHPKGEVQLLAKPYFPEIVQVGFGRVEGLAGCAVTLIDAEEAEERIGAVTEDEQVGGLGQVAVVVHQGLTDRCLVQLQGGGDGPAVVPLCKTAALIRPRAAAHHPSPAVASGQMALGGVNGRHLRERRKVVGEGFGEAEQARQELVAHGLKLGHRAAARLPQAALDQPLAQLLGEGRGR